MKARKSGRSLALVLFAAFAFSVLAPAAAQAGSEGARNTALALTAGTIYAAVRGQDTAAIALGAGSVYAWKRYGDKKTNEAYEKGYLEGRYDSRYGNRSNNRYYSSAKNYGSGKAYKPTSKVKYIKATPKAKHVKAAPKAKYFNAKGRK